MRPELLQILQHALGADEYGEGGGHRNHFCAGESDESLCRELVSMGFMVQHETTKWLPYFNCSVTRVGKLAMRDASPKPPKLTRSQRRYRAYLNADVDRSFGEWLKDFKEYNRERAGAL